jgi:ankyrin repeat protein
MYASKYGYFNIVKYLVEKGADIHIKSHYGRSALSEALSNSHTEVANYLRSIGARFVPVQVPGM